MHIPGKQQMSIKRKLLAFRLKKLWNQEILRTVIHFYGDDSTTLLLGPVGESCRQGWVRSTARSFERVLEFEIQNHPNQHML